MLQTSVFVDAGYVYAQGAAALGMPKTPRHRLRLIVPTIVDHLRRAAIHAEPRGRLLRIYWYDGLQRGGELNKDQQVLASVADVKCRFGTINSFNQQKGVDSLIVTDLSELARNRAISDAVIVGGDADIRIGVETAQQFGIRVHLLGIRAVGSSQSHELLADADTVEHWDGGRVRSWMNILPDGEPTASTPHDSDSWIEEVIRRRTADLSIEDAEWIADFADKNRNALPPEFDKPSLGYAGEVLAREVRPDERKALRARLLEAVRAIAGEPE